MSEVESLVGQAVPAIAAAVGAYGAGVLTQTEDAAAEATVRLGQRILARILHRAAQRPALEGAVVDLAENTGDADALAALRLQVRKALIQEPELLRELTGIVPSARSAPATATASGPRSVAVAGDNSGPITTGDNSSIVDLG
jgi:hypothetical protein